MTFTLRVVIGNVFLLRLHYTLGSNLTATMHCKSCVKTIIVETHWPTS